MTHPDDLVFSADRCRPGLSEESRAAFPETVGLTKREYFAAMAMQGLLANRGIMEGMSLAGSSDVEMVAKGIAAMAKGHADGLIEELNKENKKP